GTGFLYVSPQLLPRVEPVHVGDGSIAPRFNRVALGDHPAEGDWTFEPSASRFEYGTRNWHTFNALSDTIAYLTGLGWSAIEAHCAALSSELKERLRKELGVTLHSPLDWEESSALVTFGFD